MGDFIYIPATKISGLRWMMLSHGVIVCAMVKVIIEIASPDSTTMPMFSRHGISGVYYGLLWRIEVSELNLSIV